MPKKAHLSHIIPLAKLSPVEQVSDIEVPEKVPESSGVTGFAFTGAFHKATGLKATKIPVSVLKGKKTFKYAELAKAIAADSSGAPIHGENWITLVIAAEPHYAGSTASEIEMYFGRSKKIALRGQIDGFPKGALMTWDLNQAKYGLEDVPADAWDEICLVNRSPDGMKIERVKIVKSSEVILDWNCNAMLDGSRHQTWGCIGLAAKILETKLGRIDNAWQPQLHWAARELGKTDYTAYGSGTAWCSEFASWCLRKALWDTPEGSFGSQQMENYFKRSGRSYTKQQLLDGEYRLTPGDYLRWPNHSALFIKYLDDDVTDPRTKFLSIDGNVSSTVGVRKHSLGGLLSVGSTR